MVVVAHFLLARHRLVGVDVRRALGLLLRKRDLHKPLLGIEALNCVRGDEYLAAGQPPARVRHHVANDLALVVDLNLACLTDLANAGNERPTFRLPDAAQHRAHF